VITPLCVGVNSDMSRGVARKRIDVTGSPVRLRELRKASPPGLLSIAAPAVSPGTPYGRSNYCVNISIQFYNAMLQPIGHNIRLSQHTWDPQRNAPRPRCICDRETFIGDYFGNTSGGSTEYTTSVSTCDDGSNANHYQQQVVASLPIPKP